MSSEKTICLNTFLLTVGRFASHHALLDFPHCWVHNGIAKMLRAEVLKECTSMNFIVCKSRLVAVAVAAAMVTLSSSAMANLTYDESVSGNLENFPTPLDSPTNLGTLGLGANTVKGSVGGQVPGFGVNGIDVFHVTTPAGSLLSLQLDISKYSPAPSGGPGTIPNLSAYCFVPSGGVDATVGGPSSGTYTGSFGPFSQATGITVYIEPPERLSQPGNTGAVTGYGAGDYLLTMTVTVPEPATLTLLALGAIGLLFARQRFGK